MKLSKIVGRIVHHFQKLDEPAQYSDVEKLQRELEGFVESLPPHYRMYQPDKSRDQSRWRDQGQIALTAALFWLPVHRFMLLTEILVTTIILHVSFYPSGSWLIHSDHGSCESFRQIATRHRERPVSKPQSSTFKSGRNSNAMYPISACTRSPGSCACSTAP